MRFFLTTKRKYRGRIPPPLCALLISLLLSLSFFSASVLYRRATPFVMSIAPYSATRAIESIIGEAIGGVSRESEELLRGMIVKSGDNISVTVDSAAANHVRSEIASEIIKELERMRTVKVKVPLGCILGGVFFGRGPNVTVRLPANGSVACDISSSFGAAGINQTEQTVSVEVSVRLILTLPDGSITETSHTSSAELCRIMIVGAIPSTFIAK